jgi:hypothetical protein
MVLAVGTRPQGAKAGRSNDFRAPALPGSLLALASPPG